VAEIESSGFIQHRKFAIHGLPVKSGKSDWLRIGNEYSARAQKIGSGQSSRSLPQVRMIEGSGDENGVSCQNDATFSPQIGAKPYLEVFSRFGLWGDFLNDNIQATISAFRLIKNMSINPKSVEFHQCHANPDSICFFITITKITK